MIEKTANARLVLEDGTVFEGRRFGASGDADGEVVFHTALTGYQEILTDPSYAGQMVVMTYPQIGNYGISRDDFESRKIFLCALIVRENSRIASSWRSDYSLDEYLKAGDIPGLEGLDTRMLVRHLRDRGAMRGVIGGIDVNIEALIERAKNVPSMNGRDLAMIVSKGRQYDWNENIAGLNGKWKQEDLFAGRRHDEYHAVAVDYGVKWNILRHLVNAGCRVTVVPARSSAEDILCLKPDGLLLSNGPGDPDPLKYSIDIIRELLGRIPIFGICLGHQLLGFAG